MKRSLIFALVLAAVVSVTACGKDTSEKTDDTPFKVSGGEVSSENTEASSTEESKTAETSAEKTTGAEETTETSSEGTGYTASLEDVPVQTSPSAANAGNTALAPYKTASPSPDAPAPGDYNYAPAPQVYDIPGITYIDGTLIANKSYSLPADFYPELDPTCEEQFYKLANDAAAEGLNIYFSSGFRSYELQSQIYENYAARDGYAQADTYSARPGYSEHQSGLAIDVNQIDDTFIGTPEAIWLENHCHEYGFILRYPKGKQDITGYKYESWHIRYVGTDLSYKIHDLGNITLEEYFGIDSYYH